MELTVSRPAQPRVAVAAGEPAQADPRHRLEGASCGCARAYRRLARHRQAGQHRHHRRSPANWRASCGPSPRAGDSDDRLIAQRPMIAAQRSRQRTTQHATFGARLGATVAVRRTLASTIMPDHSDPTQVSRREGSSATHQRSWGFPTRASEYDQPSFQRPAPPALPGRAQNTRLLASHQFTRLHLAKADMRVDST